MNACPACSQPVTANDTVCPKCGISLHPGTATAAPSGGGGKGTPVVAIVVIVIIGVVLLVGCLGLVGAGLMFGIRSSAVVAPPTTTAPMPPVTETIEVEQSIEPLPLQANPDGGPPGQAPGESTPNNAAPEKP